MFTVTHFRTEFIHHGQAAILRKVTMTQFLLMVVLTTLAVGLLRAPFWLAPLFVGLGYAAGYSYHGEIVLKRVVAVAIVRLRSVTNRPRIVNVQAEWDAVRAVADRQQITGLLPATVANQSS